MNAYHDSPTINIYSIYLYSDLTSDPKNANSDYCRLLSSQAAKLCYLFLQCHDANGR